MRKQIQALITGCFMFFSPVVAQSLLIDLDTTTGIQNTSVIEDTSSTFAIQLRISDAEDLFSYQCKVQFDTARFTFVAAAQDFGMQGENNILTGNGGSLIGIFQLQTNPPAPDTVEFSGSITGTDPTLSVSGDGLIGVLYLKPKHTFSDSSTVTISNGFTATLNGTPVAIEEYTGGAVTVPPTVNLDHIAITPSNSPVQKTLTIACGRHTAQTTTPLFRSTGAICSFALFTPGGRCLYRTNVHVSDIDKNTIHLPFDAQSGISSACSILRVSTGEWSVSRIIQFR